MSSGPARAKLGPVGGVALCAVVVAIACHEPTGLSSRLLLPDEAPAGRTVVTLGTSAIRVPPTNGQNDGTGGVPRVFTGIHIPA